MGSSQYLLFHCCLSVSILCAVLQVLHADVADGDAEGSVLVSSNESQHGHNSISAPHAGGDFSIGHNSIVGNKRKWCSNNDDDAAAIGHADGNAEESGPATHAHARTFSTAVRSWFAFARVVRRFLTSAANANRVALQRHLQLHQQHQKYSYNSCSNSDNDSSSRKLAEVQAQQNDAATLKLYVVLDRCDDTR